MTSTLEPTLPPAPEGSNRGAVLVRMVWVGCAGAGLTVGLALLLGWLTGAGLHPVGQAVLLHPVIVVTIALGFRGAAPRHRFGPADWITLGRASLVCGLAGLIGTEATGSTAWVAAPIGLAALLLDGLDGWVARRTGTSSDFGARFDRDVDALFVLVLAILLVDLRNVGLWVLLTGGLRYAFLAGRAIWPWLATELPPSRRRKVLFGAQVLFLLAALVPAFGHDAATVFAAAGLAVVSGSFAVDIVWLHRLSSRTVSSCCPSLCEGPTS